MRKFTGGRWKFDSKSGKITSPESKIKHDMIADIWGIGSIHSEEIREESRANGRLIAAAPEMYELLSKYCGIGATPLDFSAFGLDLLNIFARAMKLLDRIDGMTEEANS